VVAHVIQLEATVEDVMPKEMTGFLMPVTVPTNLTVLTVSMVSATIKSTSTVMPFSTKCSASLMMNHPSNVTVLTRLHVNSMAPWSPSVARRTARPMPDFRKTPRKRSNKSLLAWENGLSDTWTIVTVWDWPRCHEREPKICTRNGWTNT